jgi:hypothetical protein
MLNEIPPLVLSPVMRSKPAFDQTPLLPPSETRQPAGHGSQIDLSASEMTQRVLSIDESPV